MNKPKRTRQIKVESPPKLVKSEGWNMDVEEADGTYDVAQAAYDEMLRMGITLPSRPNKRDSQFLDEDGHPVIPHNLMDLTNQEIGELYAIVQEYFSYVVGQLATVKNQHKEQIKKSEFISAKVRLAKDGTTKDKDDRKTVDRRRVIADAEAFKQECLYNLLQKVVDGLEADLKLISRNISLREQEIKLGGRLAGVGARKHFSYDRDEKRDDGPVPKVVLKKPAPRRRPSIPVRSRKK